LWDGSSSGWALFHLNAENPDEVPRYAIVNAETKRALIIEDDKVYAQVIQAMLDHRVKVITVAEAFGGAS
jgi:hypothetical protein